MRIDSEILARIAPFLTLLSHTPGRLRVRVSKEIKSLNLEFDGLSQKVNSINGIKSVKFNPLIGSITIHYDSDIIQPQFWEDILQAKSSQKLDELLKGEI